MAQLATCPHCETELLLPSLANGTTHRVCPNCGDNFDAQDLATRFVAEAIPAGNDSSPGEETDLGDLKQTLPAYSGTTLAAFLRDAEQKTRGPGHAGEDHPHDDPELSSRQTISEFDAAHSDLTPPEHGAFNDEEIEPATMEDEDAADFDRQWRGEASLRDDLEDSDKFDIPEEDEAESADDFGSQFGKFTLPDDIPELADVDGQDSGFGAEFKALDDDGTLKDFEVPEFASEAADRDTGAEDSTPSEGSPLPGAQDGNAATAVPIPARTVARRRSSGGGGMGILIKIVLGGIVGIWLAYPVALWISAHVLGRTEEPLALAQYYPNVMLPKVYQHGEAKDRPGNGQQFFAPPSAPKEKREEAMVKVPPVEPEGPVDRFALPDEPQVVATPVIVLKDTPKYNLTDLEQTTAESQKYVKELIDGTYSDPQLQPVKRKAYAKLARLAHVLACLDPAVSSHDVAEGARKVFPPLFTDARNRAELSLICGLWIPYVKRDHGGVLISGTPDEGVARGSVIEYQLQTPDGNSLTVLTPGKLDPTTYASAVTVGVVGEILYDAPVQVEGYTGTTKQAIWGAYLFPIGGP